MRGAILTAKHHDGFCLWPTRTTTHSIAASPWRDGKGDMVREIAEACRRHGLEFGVYLSPWDRNHPSYGTAAYLDVYRAQLRELLTGYGPIFEVWHDGANGGDGYYGGARETRRIDPRTYYDWPRTWELVRSLQPNAVIFSDVGPDVRWVGNEKGFANETNWATFAPVGPDGGAPAPGHVRTTESPTGHRGADRWIPAECDVSIRPGWFWHEAENGKVKTPEQLFDLYFRSVGRGCNLLLNVPPDRRGRIHEADVAALDGFGDRVRSTFGRNLAAGARADASNVRGKDRRFDASQVLDAAELKFGPTEDKAELLDAAELTAYAAGSGESADALRGRKFGPTAHDRETYWTTDDGVKDAVVVLTLPHETTFSVVRLREALALGQRVEAFAIDAWQGDGFAQQASGTTIGPSRLLRLEGPVTTSRVRLRITRAAASPAIAELSLLRAPN